MRIRDVILFHCLSLHKWLSTWQVLCYKNKNNVSCDLIMWHYFKGFLRRFSKSFKSFYWCYNSWITETWYLRCMAIWGPYVNSGAHYSIISCVSLCRFVGHKLNPSNPINSIIKGWERIRFNLSNDLRYSCIYSPHKYSGKDKTS